MEAVWSYLERARRRFPGREAAVQAGERWRYDLLYRRALGLAGELRERGIQAGDRIMLLWENSPEFIRIYFAVQRIGGLLVAVNPVNEASYVNQILADCRPKALIAQGKYLRRYAARLDAQGLPEHCFIEGDCDLPGSPRIALLADWEAERLDLPLPTESDDALILYTSGTTGRPKGVTLTQRNLIANTDAIIKYLSLDENERVLVVLPFYYSYGHSLLLSHVAAGACLVIDNRFAYPNAVLDTLAQERVTGFPGVASTFSFLMNRSTLAERRFPDLRYFSTAGGALPPAQLKRLRELLPGVKPIIMYGQTEGTARLSYLPPEDIDRKPGSIGRGIPGVRLEVLDEKGRRVSPGVTGEIVASGDNIMRGYWNDPEETARVIDEAGRLWTGDLARVDEDGYLTIVGRSKDIIKSGAYRINPKEIEDLMAEIPGVAAAAVIGIDDEMLGERMLACVVVAPGASVEERTVREFFQARLPHWKQPQEIRFCAEDFPRTASGKIQKHRLREKLSIP